MVRTALRTSPSSTCAEKRRRDRETVFFGSLLNSVTSTRQTLGQLFRPLATKREGPPPATCERRQGGCARARNTRRALARVLGPAPLEERRSPRRGAFATLALRAALRAWAQPPCTRAPKLRLPGARELWLAGALTSLPSLFPPSLRPPPCNIRRAHGVVLSKGPSRSFQAPRTIRSQRTVGRAQHTQHINLRRVSTRVVEPMKEFAVLMREVERRKR